MKTETLDEAAEKYAEENAKDGNISYHNLYAPLEYAFRNGAKWQSERMYSEEDMREAFKANYTPFSATNIGDVEQDFQKWFEQFKKKQ